VILLSIEGILEDGIMFGKLVKNIEFLGCCDPRLILNHQLCSSKYLLCDRSIDKVGYIV